MDGETTSGERTSAAEQSENLHVESDQITPEAIDEQLRWAEDLQHRLSERLRATAET